MPAGLEKQLVNAVNPRLALYTRAGLLALLPENAMIQLAHITHNFQ